MDIQQYLIDKKLIHQRLLNYLDSEDDIEEDFQNLITFFITQKIHEQRDELKEFFLLLVSVSNYYFRKKNFFDKIDRILSYFQDELKKVFSNSELFEIFQSNKRLLLFLTENNIFKFDREHAFLLFTNKFDYERYPVYFYLFIKKFLDSNEQSSLKNEQDYESESFIHNQKEGENELYICKLIRNDAISDFITYVNRNDLSLSTKIKPSIFETNKNLIQKNLELIEYAAFHGSIQIFKYLALNGCFLYPTVWIYSIHGRNPELIHFLEDKLVKSIDQTYKECIIESIRCHHNEIKDYLQLNKINNDSKFDEIIKYAAFKFRNYDYFPLNFYDCKMFFNLCKYNYYELVKILIQKIDYSGFINKLVISKSFFF